MGIKILLQSVQLLKIELERIKNRCFSKSKLIKILLFKNMILSKFLEEL